MLALCLAASAFAGEIAVLQNGYRLSMESHEIADNKIRLISKDGVIEMPASAIASIEKEADLPKEELAPQLEPSKTPNTLPVDPKALVEEAAIRYGLPPAFLHSVARVESAYRPDAISPKGAIGIMQLMPETAKLLNADPHDPAQNVDAGARHLRDLLIQYNGESGLALAAYNAGAKAVARYNGVPPYAETVDYIIKVLRNYDRLSKQAQK